MKISRIRRELEKDKIAGIDKIGRHRHIRHKRIPGSSIYLAAA
jgi:hypothetical protein